MQQKKSINFNDVEDAAKRLAGKAFLTPLLESPILNDRVGARVLLKPENLQRMGAFKFRGAYNAISRLSPETCPGGVVTSSSGNHASGVAEAARLCGLPATIVMPKDAPDIKKKNTEGAGAKIVFYDRATENREEIAEAISQESGAIYIPPYDHPDIMAGQGTAGLELMTQARERGALPDMLLSPCGGGGLVAGLATAVCHINPDLEVYAVEPEKFDDLARSLASGEREKNPSPTGSICDALLAPIPGELTFEVNRSKLAGALLVSDEEVRHAMRFAYTTLKLVVEPGGAAALAALLSGRVDAKGKTIAVILSGGNVDGPDFAAVLSEDAA